MPQEKTKESILQLIRDLLALSHSPNEHEAALAATRAQSLLFKHKLSLAEVEEGGKEKSSHHSVTKEKVDTYAGKNKGIWKIQLLNEISHYNFCKTLYSTWNHQSWLIGNSEDIEVVKELYFWISEQLERECRKACRSYCGSDRIPTFRRAFYVGAVFTISSRLRENWNMLKNQSVSSTALVVRSEAMVKEYILENFLRVREGHNGKPNTSVDGWLAGKQAGRNIDLNPSKRLEE